MGEEGTFSHSCNERFPVSGICGISRQNFVLLVLLRFSALREDVEVGGGRVKVES